MSETLTSTLARKYKLEVDASDGNIAGTAALSTDIITSTAHGLSEGDPVVFTTVVAPLVAGTTYYAKTVTVNTFKVSATSGGTAVDLSADGAVVLTGDHWLQVRALKEFTPGLDTNLEDDSDYDSDGWSSSTKTQLGWKIDAKLMRKIGIESGDPDPGQEILRLAAESFGTAGIVHVRWYDRDGGPEAYSGYAEVSWSPDGGDTTALASVSVTLTGKGPRTPITNPAA